MTARLPEELQSHPLAQEIARIAEKKALTPTDWNDLANILEQVDGVPVDAKTMLLLTEMVQRISRFDKTLSLLSNGINADSDGKTDMSL